MNMGLIGLLSESKKNINSEIGAKGEWPLSKNNMYFGFIKIDEMNEILNGDDWKVCF